MGKAFRKTVPQSDTPLTTRDANLVSIPNLKLALNLGEMGYYNVSLTVPDTWNDQAGSGASFAISFNNEIIARGFYSTGLAGQRVPVHLDTVVRIDSGKNVIEAKWCTYSGGQAYIGGVGTTILLALLLAQVSEISEGELPEETSPK